MTLTLTLTLTPTLTPTVTLTLTLTLTLLWALRHACFWSTDFESALFQTVNHLGDADTTGAIAGQIAGAFYGHRGIPADHLERMRRWDDGEIELRAALLRGLEDHCRGSNRPRV